MPLVWTLKTHEERSRYLRDLFSRTYIRDVLERRQIKNDAEITGFGGNDKGSVYSIPDFSIGSITFSPFEVFVPEILRIKYPILLSAPVFYGTVYEFDTQSSLFKSVGETIIRKTEVLRSQS